MKEAKVFSLPERKGPNYFNMQGLYCPNDCETESYTIEINRRPELVEAVNVYIITCNQCEGVIVEQPYNEQTKI